MTNQPSNAEPPAQDARAVRSRAALVAAARELLLTDSSLSVSEICRQAQVSRPTFYQHFDTPEALIASMVRERLDGLNDALADVPAADSIGFIRALLEEVGLEPRSFNDLLGGNSALSQVRPALEEWLTERLAERYPYSTTHAQAFAAGGTVRLVAITIAEGGGEAELMAIAMQAWQLVRASLELPEGVREPDEPTGAHSHRSRRARD